MKKIVIGAVILLQSTCSACMQESRYASCNAITSAVQIPANIMQSGTEQLAQPAVSSHQEELRMSAVEAQQALNVAGTKRARLLALADSLGVDISAVNARTPTSNIRQMIQDHIAHMQPAASSQQEELRMSAVEAQQALNECGTNRARLLGLVGRLGVDTSAIRLRTPTSSIRQMIQDRIALMQRVEQSMTED